MFQTDFRVPLLMFGVSLFSWGCLDHLDSLSLGIRSVSSLKDLAWTWDPQENDHSLRENAM